VAVVKLLKVKSGHLALMFKDVESGDISTQRKRSTSVKVRANPRVQIAQLYPISRRRRGVRLASALAVILSVVAIGTISASSAMPMMSAAASVPSNANRVVGIAPTPDGLGYRTLTAGGFIPSYGDATYLAGPGSDAPFVGINESNDDESGFWCVAADGGVFTLGDAAFYGSMGGKPLNAPIVGMASTPDGQGYWLVGADGGIFSFGDAAFYGSMGGKPLNAPIVGMASTPDGQGYWLVAADGGIFSFGDAAFYGSMGGKPLNAPIVGMAADAHGGYWLVAGDGGIFSFGDAPFYGSKGGTSLVAPISSMAATKDGGGYWLVGTNNAVFAFGDAPFLGPTYFG
jgi:hypothetical protein